MTVDAWFAFWINNLMADLAPNTGRNYRERYNRHNTRVWRAGPPKSKSSYRTIPLTNRAYDILKSCYDERHTRKESEVLSQILEYVDRRTGETKYLCMRDLVFINFRTGEPAKNSSYDTHLYKLCDEPKIKRFCMHALRHPYVKHTTKNKSLQKQKSQAINRC